ncbi:MAG: trigger factor [Candidatus Marinimicrobia bacterium]|jgi:trigger factor|nr:trigger factor [Candidatus Neomarinimicrobiota bacterium]MDP7059493.1 trigger factor [Candidatus Neomarinimicrobiota bacterium]|tara:strand:+ start:557 stop:1852 length:1296 start_codon:yes stop_codon:yes gene_type:complete
MNVKLKEIDSYTRQVTVSVPWEDLESAFEAHIRRFSKKVRMPGFRKGKVPQKVVIQNFGPELEAEFAQDSIEIHYAEALQEHKIVPVNRAKIEDLQFSEGSSLNFKATVEVEPAIKLPKYNRKMKVKKNVYVPDNTDVDAYIEEVRRQFAEVRTIEEGSSDGHLLLVDMQEMDSSGVPIIGKKVEDRYIKVGDGVFGGTNLSRLTGLKVGDTTIVEAETTKEGGLTRYELTIKNVQEEVFPEMNEEFIKKIDSEATNETSFRENVMKRIQERLDRDAEGQLNEAIIDYFLQSTDLEPPPSMVDHYIEHSIEQAKSNNGETFDEDKYRNEARPSVVRSIKWVLIRKALIKGEQLWIPDEELDENINKILESTEDEKGQIRRYYKKSSNKEKLRDDLLDRSLFQKLKEYAKISEVTISTSDLRKQHELSTEGA